MSKAKHKKKRAPYVPPVLSESPTPERMVRGDYEAVRIEKNGPKVYRDRDVLWLETMRDKGKGGITHRRYLAADQARETLRRKYSTSPTRSCLDNTIPGTGEETAAEHQVQLDRDVDLIRSSLGWVRFAVVRGVLVGDAPTGPRTEARQRWRMFIEGLDILADAWRIGGRAKAG